MSAWAYGSRSTHVSVPSSCKDDSCHTVIDLRCIDIGSWCSVLPQRIVASIWSDWFEQDLINLPGIDKAIWHQGTADRFSGHDILFKFVDSGGQDLDLRCNARNFLSSPWSVEEGGIQSCIQSGAGSEHEVTWILGMVRCSPSLHDSTDAHRLRRTSSGHSWSRWRRRTPVFALCLACIVPPCGSPPSASCAPASRLQDHGISPSSRTCLQGCRTTCGEATCRSYILDTVTSFVLNYYARRNAHNCIQYRSSFLALPCCKYTAIYQFNLKATPVRPCPR